MELTDEQWAILEPLIPIKEAREDGKGRPRLNYRAVLDGILWVLRTGAAWQDLPDRYPSPATCHRRFQELQREGVLERILTTLADDLAERGKLDLSECFIDGTFVAVKKGAVRRKDQAGQRYEDHGSGRPRWSSFRRSPGKCFAAKCPQRYEVTLMEATIASRFVAATPRRLIGDRAYDSDPLDRRLRVVGIELIAPHRRNRVKPKTQDGRKLRRFKRR